MIFHYEPIVNVDKEYLDCRFPIELLQGIYDSYHVNYDDRGLIFVQKDFNMARQFFVRRVCKYGLPATEAFKMIEQVKIVGNERMWVLGLVEKKYVYQIIRH